MDGRVDEPVRAGEVDDDRVGRRHERGGRVVVEAAEDELGAGGQRLVVRDEDGQRPVPVAAEPRVERVGRLPGERVGSERDELEPGVREHPVERLLPGKAGCAEDGGRNHLRIMQKARIYATR